MAGTSAGAKKGWMSRKSGSRKKLPSMFNVNPAKIKANPLPKSIKKKGIDSPEYKSFIYKHWR